MSSCFPDILLQDVFDYLDAEPLMLSAMPVSRYWRDTAINHAIYWRDIQVGGGYPDPPRYAESLSLFVLRLERAEFRPVRLSISWERVDGLDTVLDAIVPHLSHIEDLIFYGLLSTSDRVLSALCRSTAPMMKKFVLELLHDYARPPYPVAVIPHDLFAGQARNLHRVSIRDLTLETGDAFPPCLATVAFLTVGYSSPDYVPPNRPLPNLFLHCRSLQELHIIGFVDLSDPVYRMPSMWSLLPTLRLREGFRQPGWDVLALPVGGVGRIDFSGGDALSVVSMANMLGPRISVGFDWRQPDQRRRSVHTRLRSVSDTSGRIREAELPLPKYDPLFPYDAIAAYQHAPVVSRIVQLGLALRNWDDLVGAGYLTRFPALEELVLTIFYWPPEDGWWRPEPSARLSCPRLDRLILRRQRWSQPLVVAARNVVEFAAGALADVRFPIVLELNEATLDGSLEESRDLFSFVVTSDTKEYEFKN